MSRQYLMVSVKT